MSRVLVRATVVLAVAALGVWLLGSRVPTQTDALPDADRTRPAAQEERSDASDREPSRRRADSGLGVQLSAHHGSDPAPALAVMDRLAEAGAGWVRVDVGWATLQPRGPGAFDQWYVDLIDAVLAGARERGLRVILDLWLTPPWASATGSLHAPPDDAADYAAAIGRAAQRWGDDVAAWEVWNEPNFDTFFAGADPATYTRLLCAAYPAVKRHDDSPVLFGGLMYNDDAWLEEAYAAGAGDCFDALATHPYVGPSDAAPDTPSVGAVWRLTHTPAVRAVMERWGDADKQIWITELGWSSGPDNRGNPWDRSVSPRTQARFLAQAVELVRAEYPYVGPIIWYRDIDGPTDAYQDGFGLLHPDLRAKPAMRAFAAAAAGERRPRR
ncbi:cellulase family glycosylhydrolase [Nocardioides sp. SYSU DS0651]|uniref:cellulase family glycosylhydrolase n=1 Tax=Nocardioides sp. SYSU DS0651 TaxID=3415955 RepID=UPI003F4B18E8